MATQATGNIPGATSQKPPRGKSELGTMRELLRAGADVFRLQPIEMCNVHVETCKSLVVGA